MITMHFDEKQEITIGSSVYGFYVYRNDPPEYLHTDGSWDKNAGQGGYFETQLEAMTALSAAFTAWIGIGRPCKK